MKNWGGGNAENKTKNNGAVVLQKKMGDGNKERGEKDGRGDAAFLSICYAESTEPVDVLHSYAITY